MAEPGGGSARAARRALIVLLGADGLAHTEVAQRCGTSVPTVRLWRVRYAEGGIGALQDLPRPGRPHTIDEAAMVAQPWRTAPARLSLSMAPLGQR